MKVLLWLFVVVLAVQMLALLVTWERLALALLTLVVVLLLAVVDQLYRIRTGNTSWRIKL